MEYAKILSLETGIKENYSENIINLLDEGCTIPFIARYRKELTGGIDDQDLRNFSDRLNYLRNLDKRKEEVVKSITEQEKMTPELAKQIEDAVTLAEVEDLYRPFKPKRQTRATIAVAKGLQPFADLILAQTETSKTIEEIASQYINEEKGVLTVEEAIQGASDIVAETISDTADTRKSLKIFLDKSAEIVTELKDEDNEKAKVYDMYASYSEPIKQLPSHRILAINRGEKEDCLKVSLKFNEEKCLEILTKYFVKSESIFKELLTNTIIPDSFDRLLMPSLEREIRNNLTEKASEQAIKMFQVNLKPLLMQPPLKGKTILGLDPAYRTGCKLAVINENGTVLDKGVIYPTPPHNKIDEAEVVVLGLLKKHGVNTISIGNGTASKESEIFVANLIKKNSLDVNYMVVSEAGASVYSASKLGAEEFPDYDVSLRSAVSIARRLQDPLAELIKIDVKSIGVGQYQHDMPQARLTEVLDGVVENCVNSVGADLNTASPSLLSKISGLNSGTAKNIVKYRDENGAFTQRKELLKVPKIGAKAFEQCAGFLRIPNGKNILDNTGVHPESYDATEKLLKLFNLTDENIKNGTISNLPRLVEDYGKTKVSEELGIGELTLEDIVKEIVKPGRDIRDSLPAPVLRQDLLSIEDLKVGMVLTGTVRNVIDFGAFVDIGVHQDGLVHISQICDKYIKHPSEELSVGQIVKVKIMGIDINKNKISLTMRDLSEEE